ncbi:ATP-binding cassette domain-containing protein [Novosphingobium sp. FGD1]|jgi:ABC-2 type transport system ATP-binding protein|uniref:ATP-binding cassette domain-containing protein n=1 Tax=Novosphingobium silvae TaxID=2692619 RepID=A0A7X4GG16_9SPHN|nr:ABC transporter ATP-binding protein [Novosphingobium silvae]MYL97980.1 ATP-binding cassette domain-containing protein [Novosphingobium silvae]
MQPILEIAGLTKTYKGGFTALRNVDLSIRKGEIFALLGPNGAGKTTLIGAVCGLVRPSSGTIHAFGEDMGRHWRRLRARVGLVPQELATDMFEPVLRSVNHSRGLFGLAPNPALIEEILRALSLWDKRDAQIRTLSGGMKRRVLIAKALAHEPELLFLDEPTAGVDVELRRDMWKQIARLRERGTTVILTTHYIEEAEEMADRVGIIRKGEILMVDDKATMMKRLGRVEALISLAQPLAGLPEFLSAYPVTLIEEGAVLCYRGGEGGVAGTAEVAELTKALTRAGIDYTGIDIHESSLEDIFVNLLEGPDGPSAEAAA